MSKKPREAVDAADWMHTGDLATLDGFNAKDLAHEETAASLRPSVALSTSAQFSALSPSQPER
jgi:predicted HAD superfamily hydrolase